MTRTGEQLLARFFFPLSFPAGFIRLARSSLFLIFHPLHSLIILIFHPLNKNLSPDFPTSLVLPSPLPIKNALFSRRRLRRSPRPAAGDRARTGCGDVIPAGVQGQSPCRGAREEPLPCRALAKRAAGWYNRGMQQVLSPMRRAIQDYKMISDGDRIFVGLSGGKDSVLLTAALAAYRRFSPESFTLEAISIDMGFERKDDADERLTDWCESLGVPRHIVRTDIAEIVFEARKEKSPCSLCAKMRRGALNNEINRLGGGTLALGHNADDVAETVLLSLLYEGRFSCFAPTAYMDKSAVKLIRPFIYIEECDIVGAVGRLGLPVVPSVCPEDKVTRREYAKQLIKQLTRDNPSAKRNIMGAVFHPERAALWQRPAPDETDR